MLSLILAVSMVGQEGGKIVKATQRLVGGELCAMARSDNGNTSATALSLIPGASWDSGTVWLICDKSAAAEETAKDVFACKGRYEIYGNKLDDDTLMLELRFTRKFDGTPKDGGYDWQLDTNFSDDPTGVMLEVGLEERTVPQEMRMVVEEAFWVGKDGNRSSHHQSARLRDVLFGGKDDVYRTTHLKVGKEIKLSPSAARMAFMRDTPPPGFRLRPTAE